MEGKWPENSHELIVVLSDPHQISDMMAYTLGLKEQKLLDKILDDIMSGKVVEEVSDTQQWTYEDLLGVKLRLVDVSSLYRYNEEYALWEDMSEDHAYMEAAIKAGEKLEIVGIVCAREGVNATALSTGVAYTSALTRRIMELASGSEIVKQQLADPEVNVFSGSRFDEENEKELNFEDMISVDSDAISSAFGMRIREDDIVDMLQGYLNEVMNNSGVDTKPAANDFLKTLRKMATEMLVDYVAANGNSDGKAGLVLSDAELIVDQYLKTPGAIEKMKSLGREQKYENCEFLSRDAILPYLEKIKDKTDKILEIM